MNRRLFVKKASVGSAAVVAGSSVLLAAPNLLAKASAPLPFHKTVEGEMLYVQNLIEALRTELEILMKDKHVSQQHILMLQGVMFNAIEYKEELMPKFKESLSEMLKKDYET